MSDPIPQWLQDFANETGAVITEVYVQMPEIPYSIPQSSVENSSNQGEQWSN